MNIFKGQNLLEFAEVFNPNYDCKKYLSDINIKCKTGYSCTKCGHSASQNLKRFGRICNVCSHIESATANILFHKVKFGVLASCINSRSIISSILSI